MSQKEKQTKLCCLFDKEETCDCERASKGLEEAYKSNNQKKVNE